MRVFSWIVPSILTGLNWVGQNFKTVNYQQTTKPNWECCYNRWGVKSAIKYELDPVNDR